METLFSGVDISKKEFHSATASESECRSKKRFEVKSFLNRKEGINEFIRFLRKTGKGNDIHVVMEATGVYGDKLSSTLSSKGIKVSVVNARLISNYAKSKNLHAKTDKLDAMTILEYAVKVKPEETVLLSKTERELRNATRLRYKFQQELTMITNQLEAFLEEGLNDRFCINLLKEQEKLITTQLEKLDGRIYDIIKRDVGLNADYELLRSIPGINSTAGILLAELMPLLRAGADVRGLVAYAGLCPHIMQSGSSVKSNGHLIKQRNKRIGTSLYFPTLCAIRHNPVIKEKYERLAARGKPKMVAVVACMRKMLCIAYGVLKTRNPFDPNWNKKCA